MIVGIASGQTGFAHMLQKHNVRALAFVLCAAQPILPRRIHPVELLLSLSRPGGTK